MAKTDLTPGAMAAMHPGLFRAARPPLATFAEQHAAALAVVQQSLTPAGRLMAEFDAIARAQQHAVACLVPVRGQRHD